MTRKRPQHNEDIHDREIEVAAFLYYRGWTEQNVAVVLNCAVATVGNRLAEARRRGLLVEERHFHRGRMIEPERFIELERLDYTVLMQEKLRQSNSRFRQLTVLDSGGVGESPQAFDFRLRRFAQRLAPLLSALLLKRSTRVGVSWGTTLGAAVEALSPKPDHAVTRSHHLLFVPICGEPCGAPHREKSSSYLAGMLDQFLNNSQGHYLSLAGVPAVIPLHFLDEKADHVIRRFFQEATAYGEIFGRAADAHGTLPHQTHHTRPVIETLDTILTSVGAVDKPWRMCGRKLCETGGIPEQRFHSLVLGDVAGVLIPREEAMAEDFDFQRIEAAWTGIRREHLGAIARQATPNGSPGVVVIAIGHNKAESLLTVIRQGLVNQLFCDDDLARKLADLGGLRVTPQAIYQYLRKQK